MLSKNAKIILGGVVVFAMVFGYLGLRYKVDNIEPQS